MSNKTRKKRVFDEKDYESNDGMLTTIWGPTMWHNLHAISFNYPVKPTLCDKRRYRDFILSLKHVLPCGKCRNNLKANFKKLPLRLKHMESRDSFSKYIYDLHETINEMLCKKNDLTYEDVRERYEHFRSRCAIPYSKRNRMRKTKKTEKGCTEPLYGEKSKCILRIVPQTTKCEIFDIDKQCMKQHLNPNSNI